MIIGFISLILICLYLIIDFLFKIENNGVK